MMAYLKIVKKINYYFILLILILLYFIGVGLSWVLVLLFHHPKKEKRSYWETLENKLNKKGYLESPY